MNAKPVPSKLDQLIMGFDHALRVSSGVTRASRATPVAAPDAAAVAAPLSDAERRHSAGLMRINHVGEVCAQALYQAQARFAKSPALRKSFEQAGREEADHLAWTAERLAELGAQPSLLNPLWYAGSYALGTLAAQLGDGKSLGFVVETERQVEAHLASHLAEPGLPQTDTKSRAIVEQMRQDEVEHGANAKAMGAEEPPLPARKAMQAMARLMTSTAYYL